MNTQELTQTAPLCEEVANIEVRAALELLEETNRQLTRANRRMRQNLLAAAKVQQSLLPVHLPKFKHLRFGWRFHPCDELAGDILDIFRLDQDHVGLYLLDVSGHGTAAALLAVSVSRLLSPMPHASSLVREHAHDDEKCVERIAPPAEVAARLNAQFPWDPATGQFFTLIYGVLNVRTLEFRYVAAGHPGPAHFPRGQAPQVPRSSGLPIGVGNFSYQEQVLQLQPGERLFLYSDGVTDVMNAERELFGVERLLKSLDAKRGQAVEPALDALLDELSAWGGAPRFHDDISLVAVDLPI